MLPKTTIHYGLNGFGRAVLVAASALAFRQLREMGIGYLVYARLRKKEMGAGDQDQTISIIVTSVQPNLTKNTRSPMRPDDRYIGRETLSSRGK